MGEWGIGDRRHSDGEVMREGVIGDRRHSDGEVMRRGVIGALGTGGIVMVRSCGGGLLGHWGQEA